MQLLLLSNSTMKGQPYLGWPQPYLQSFLENIDELLFIPYAGVTMSYDEYTASVNKALEPTGVRVTGIHTVADKVSAVRSARTIAVGGGNTFHLLAKMQEEGLLGPVREAVTGGTPYIGWSAGSNVACPTIMTTNDMPIVEPESFQALGLTDFQINAHYTTRTIPGHGGESRDLRLKELLVINKEMKVIGLPEGKLLHYDGNQWHLQGIDTEETILFRSGTDPEVLRDGVIEI